MTLGSLAVAPSIGWLATPASFDADDVWPRRTPGRADVPSSPLDVETSAIDARDAAWMAGVARNDMVAFRALFDAYIHPLVRLANGYVRNPDVAHDVVQDVFITIWDRRTSLVITRHVAGYLARATRNRALKAIRSSARAARWAAEAARDDQLLYPVAENLGDRSLEAEDFRGALRAALLQLPARQREVFLLHREQGLDYATIAGALGVTVPSVYNTVSRAIARLRTLLSDYL